MSSRPHDAPASAAPPAGQTDPLAALRQATQALHARLDASLPIARADAGLQDYVGHARALTGWLAALAPELDALEATQEGFSFDIPNRLEALRADLLDAGSAPAPSATATGTSTRSTIEQALLAHAAQATACRWGMAYVVEGSQLGGQVLFRRLSQNLGTHPLRYLQGRGGDGTGARWRNFIARLRSGLTSDDAVRAACAGAIAAFDGMAHELRAQGAPL